MFDPGTKLWVVHISNNAEIARRAEREGFICIGWTVLGDLSSMDTREKMKAAYRKAMPKKSDASVRSSYGQVFRFAHEMQVGDAVVYPIKGSRYVMIGCIAGPYRWASGDNQLVEGDYCNVRKVEWLKTVERIAFSDAALHSFGAFSSVATADEHLEEVIGVLTGEKRDSSPRFAKAASGADEEPESPETDAVEDRADEAGRATEDFLLRKWVRTAQDFEEVVAAVLRAMGYTARCMEGTHDRGVDVLAHRDPLGVDSPTIKVQCKSGTGSVGAPAVQQLRGLLNHGEKGILVSLGGFSNDAKHVEQNDADIVLIDAQRFVELFLNCYESLDPAVRHRFPLTRVFVPAE